MLRASGVREGLGFEGEFWLTFACLLLSLPFLHHPSFASTRLVQTVPPRTLSEWESLFDAESVVTV